MKLTAQVIADWVGVGADHYNKSARRVGILGEQIGSSHAHFYTESEALKVYPRKARVIKKLFASAAAAGFPSKRPPTPGRVGAGAMPMPAHSPTGAAADSFLMQPSWQRSRSAARAAILAAEVKFAANSEVRHPRGPFIREYNSLETVVDDQVRALYPIISAKRLQRWTRLKAKGGGGTAALGPRWGSRCSTGILDTNIAMRDVVLAMIAQWPSHLRAPRVVEALRARFPHHQIPSASTVRAFIRRWHREHPSVALATRNPDRWKSTHRVKIADAAAAIARLNQEWQIDGTPGDVMLTDGRYHILAIIDVYSRRVMFHVARSESANAAVRLICRAMVAWGVPEIIHGDNGAGFVSNYAARFLDDLGIQYVASPPFRPETKPFVESVIATTAHELLAMLPGFTGHSVAQRQELRARSSFAARFGAPALKTFEVQLTAQELQARLDTWAEHQYGNRIHSGTGFAPNVLAAEWQGEVRRIADERALAILAEEAVARRIGRDGIAIAGARFVATLETIGSYVAHLGENCLVFPDPSGDMGRYFLFLDTPRGREFLAIVENVERLGADRSELALIARQAQDKFVREGRAELRKIKKKIRPETIVDEVLAHAASGNGAGGSRGLDEVVHATTALAAATLAQKTHTTPAQPVTYDPEALARADAILARAELTSSRFLTDDELYLLWKEVRAARAAGLPVDADTADYADRFEQTAAFETRLMLDDDCVAEKRVAS